MLQRLTYRGFSFGLLLTATLVLLVTSHIPGHAQEFKVSNTDRICPTDYKLATPQQARRACGKKLAQWDIVRLAGGRSISGPGYNCTINDKDYRTLGGSLCWSGIELSPNITPFPIKTYADVIKMFNDYVKDNPINIQGSPHKDFWNMKKGGYKRFTQGNSTKIDGMKIADCQTPSSANSNIIALLRGQTPPHAVSDPGRMPELGPYFPEAQIKNLADWIDNGCKEK